MINSFVLWDDGRRIVFPVIGGSVGWFQNAYLVLLLLFHWNRKEYGVTCV
jgi:hypothetical protein